MDKFTRYAPSITGPADDWIPITPDDNADLPFLPRALTCTGAGTAVIVSASGNEMSAALDPLVERGLRPVRVRATGTTATGIYGLV
ncbi:spike base protein, RCAP_Rcc01079 family [Tropicimonas isoalkanivorans]|uniref:Uncharacterized protein n=1 Tax=Tropicimonas isoalkanivorans TaxID=441112 RepID=A0A1I1E6Z7_9RHOB|nr:hypothetical protein [Tropicimonas isoalkanivorans]SFB82446.1 hypothetical protein SAMN04488094_101653 [Tropicimonas isoalkanivorans]